MSELFEDNNENKTENDSIKKLNLEKTIDTQEQKDISMSLDDRKEQLENKINKEMGERTDTHNGDNAPKPDVFDKVQTRIKSPYDSPPTTGYNYNNPGSRMQLPKMRETPPNSGSSYDVYNNYYNGYNGYNGYYNYYNRPTNPNVAPDPRFDLRSGGNTAVSPYAVQTPKEKTNTALKSYLIIIVGITVVFLVGFILECVNNYREDGIFGGENGILSKDFDKYLDSDYDFGFKFNRDDSDEDEKGDSDNTFDFVDNGSDNDLKDLNDAPDERTVVNKSAANIKTVDQPEDIDSAKYTAKDVFKKVENTVVNIVVYDGDIGDNDSATGTGSGIIISEDGYIVTNSHVINDSKKYSVEIITTEGESYAAAIVGFDTRTDLAVLKINGTGLASAEFVNSDQIEVGQDAIAVGNPGGMDYSNSLTRGCVSALNRTVSSNKLVPYIQTDAAINPGNSGGPLLNSAGQVMGIATIKIANSDYEGMGFAIPSNTVVSIANDLIGQGYVSNRVRIGIEGVAVSEEIFTDTPAGISIRAFSEDSPFNGTDAKEEDIITAINGKNIENFNQLFSELDKYNSGDTVTVTLYRASTSTGSSKTFDVKIKLIADNGETQN